MRPAELAYEPREYWSRRVAGNGALANVGQIALGEYNRYTYPLRLEAFERALATCGVTSPRRVFDAGFGEGVYLRYWRERGVREVAGLDLSDRAVAAGRARFPGYDLRAGDLTRAESVAGFATYDVVTAVDVLYHVVDDDAWAAALAHLTSLVAPGGAFLFSDKFPSRRPLRAAAHVKRRPLAVWQAALDSLGFEVIARLPVFVLMDDPITCGSHPWLGRVARAQWRVAAKLIRVTTRSPRLHRATTRGIVALQRPVERLLVRRLTTTPNLEIAVARRRPPAIEDTAWRASAS